MPRQLPLLVLLAAQSLGGLPAADAAGRRVWGTVDGDPVVDVVPRDAIRAVGKPRFVTAVEGDRFMRAEELVIGITVEGEARAYSTELLDHHEVVNDRIGGSAIAATW
jgi:hypothetical protein